MLECRIGEHIQERTALGPENRMRGTERKAPQLGMLMEEAQTAIEMKHT